MSEDPTVRDSTALGNLQVTLEAALHLLRDLADDDLLRRMIAVFHAMPEGDRPVVVDVLERATLQDFVSRAESAGIKRAALPTTMYFI